MASALSPTGCRHQAQELALPVELGLVSESAHVLCSPTNFSEGSRFTEVFFHYWASGRDLPQVFKAET